MKVGILGSGNVAQVLGNGFLSRGHEVMLGTSDSAKLSEWKSSAGAHASVGSFADAASFGEILVLATHGDPTPDLLVKTGPERFAGKVVLDATNPLDGAPPHLTVGFSDSLGERVQRAIPQAHVVKVYNTVGAHYMIDPKFPEGPPDMFIAGNDDGAKKRVEELVRAFGWNVLDMGGIEASRLLEPLAMAWISYGMRSGNWNHAWKLIRA